MKDTGILRLERRDLIGLILPAVIGDENGFTDRKTVERSRGSDRDLQHTFEAEVIDDFTDFFNCHFSFLNRKRQESLLAFLSLAFITCFLLWR